MAVIPIPQHILQNGVLETSDILNLYYLLTNALANDIAIDGGITASSLITANGGLTVPSGQTATVASSTITTLDVTGNTTLSGALNANGGLSVPSGQTATVAGTLDVTGSATVPAATAAGQPLSYGQPLLSFNYTSSAQAITGSTWTTLIMPTKNGDINNSYNTTTGAITVAAAGWYLIIVSTSWTASTGSTAITQYILSASANSGTPVVSLGIQNVDNGNTSALNGSGASIVAYLAAGTYYLNYYSNTPVTLGGTTATYIAMRQMLP